MTAPTLAAPEQITAYGAQVIAVEPTGAEPVPEAARHGRPLSLLWTWTSPNMEFATVFIGVLAVGIFGLGFWPAVASIVLGTALGSVTQGLLSITGPRYGVPQMVVSRSGFGFRGNILPAGLNALTAGIGWFAVNSVSAAYALNTLLSWNLKLCLLIVVVLQIAIAFLGHNFIHAAEKYAFPVLAVVFVIACVAVLAKSHPSTQNAGWGGSYGGFWLATSAAFGYACGWNPYASDYTRYLPKATARWRVALWPGLGVFVSCLVLEVVGAAAATVAIPQKTFSNLLDNDPTALFTYSMHTWLADLTLLAIALGGIAANALNIYSGALSFVAMGIKLPAAVRRATVALLFGVLGTVVAYSGLNDAATKYNNFLLVIAYWISPWLAVVFVDRYLRRKQGDEEVGAMLEDVKHSVWAGPLAMLIGAGVSIWLFSNQTDYTGPVAKHFPQIGDITFVIGFVLAAVLYLVLLKVPGLGSRSSVAAGAVAGAGAGTAAGADADAAVSVGAGVGASGSASGAAGASGASEAGVADDAGDPGAEPEPAGA